ncbi:MAG: HipA domain-containing protein, partial [Rickettsiales bacterium]|nr:HipA domain-containing protein [Rickettsiales bacterium]
TEAILSAKASLSGVQRKFLAVKEGKNFRPVRDREISTHIAKLSSGNYNEIIEIEFLTSLATQKLLPKDDIVEMQIAEIPYINEKALIITRFDRTHSGRGKIHFEEMSQLLNKKSGDAKYDGSYEDMGRYISENPYCMPVEAQKLFSRILVCFLLGNTDAHFKNFAMFHKKEGLRLTPAYDLVSAYMFNYKTLALEINGVKDLNIGNLEVKHLVNLGYKFGLNDKIIMKLFEDLSKNLDNAKKAISESKVGSQDIKNKLTEIMEKRWNGSFSLIGNYLLNRQSREENHKS